MLLKREWVEWIDRPPGELGVGSGGCFEVRVTGSVHIISCSRSETP